MSKRKNSSEVIKAFFKIYCAVKQYYHQAFIVDKLVRCGIMHNTPYNMQQCMMAEDGRQHLFVLREQYVKIKEMIEMKNDSEKAMLYIRLMMTRLPFRYKKEIL